MTSVLALTRYDRKGASSRVRFRQFVEPLRARGIEVTLAPFFDDAYLWELYARKPRQFVRIGVTYARRLRQLLGARRYDVVWLEKEALPWLPAWLETGCLRGTRYVVDFDDAWFHRYGGHHWSLLRILLGGKLEAVVRRAQSVVVGNTYLEAWARAAGANNVVRLPSVVDTDRYPGIPAGERGTFTIGWIGHPLTAGYLHEVAAALRTLSRDETMVVRVVGAADTDLHGVRLECRPWCEQREVSEIEAFDVGIMPLPDTPWERGKCGYKLIQYMAAARPVVASPVGASGEIVKAGETGFLASGQEEWIAALTRLRDDPQLRREMGRRGRARVEACYSVQSNVATAARVLAEAAGKVRDPHAGAG